MRAGVTKPSLYRAFSSKDALAAIYLRYHRNKKQKLFDEKIAGSFHFTPGQAYDGVGNGNKSQVHWDMVCIQRPEYGGGEIWFDDVLIRKDGLFVPKALHKLNPDNLLGKVK